MSDAELNIWNRTPQARYQREAKFKQLVDMMEAYMHQAEFTPTEMREAALLTAIHYEYHQVRHIVGYTISRETETRCRSLLHEVFEAIQKDERPMCDTVYP